MSTGSIGEETGGKQRWAKAQAKAQSKSNCAFCWFVLALYPTLKDIVPRDAATFKAHLEKAHGLREEIPA